VYLKSGGVPAVLSGAMISMGRTLEKLGPALYSPECVKACSKKFALKEFTKSIYSYEKKMNPKETPN
jgi:hypothetical protein